MDQTSRSRVTIILRLVDEAGAEEYAMNVQHPKSKLSVPLMEILERFARHFNRRSSGSTVEARALEAQDAHGALDPKVPVGNLIDEVEAHLEVRLKRGAPLPTLAKAPELEHELPAASPVLPASDQEKRAGAIVLRGYDLPPPDTLLFTKDEFDDVLAGLDTETLLVIFFEKTRDDSGPCAKLAPAYRRLARHFWPAAVLVRVDVDDNKPTALANGVKTAPTIVFFKNRKKVDKMQGGNELTINVKIVKWLKEGTSRVDPPNRRGGSRPMAGEAWGSGFLS